MLVEKKTPHLVNLHYDLYIPAAAEKKSLPLLIALHGYEGNKESMMALAQRINRDDFLIASVQGPNGFFVRDEREQGRPRIGFGWMMMYKADETIDLHHRVIRAVIEETAAAYAVNREQIFLLAFSQSVSLNYRFAFTHPKQIRGVVAVCGGIPGDWDEEGKYQQSDTEVLIIAGDTDEFYPLERTRTFKEAIARRAAAVEFRNFPTGHVFMRESLPLINDWLLARITES